VLQFTGANQGVDMLCPRPLSSLCS